MRFRHIAMPPKVACAALRHRRKLLLGRIGVLCAGSDANFAPRFPGLVAAVEAAFRHEEALLELVGDACLRPRRADHAVILCALHRTASQVERGDVVLGRQVLAALAALLGQPGALPPAPPARLMAPPP
jgi:hypothetical protein